MNGKKENKRSDLVIVVAEAEVTSGVGGSEAAVAVRVARTQTGRVLKQIVSKKT